jgi:CIC family chloride channel protein
LENNSGPLAAWFRQQADKLRTIFDFESSGRLMVFSALVGAAAGLGAIAFYVTLDALQEHLLCHIMEYCAPGHGDEGGGKVTLPSVWWLVLLIPTAGGLACGWLVYTFAPEAEGHGTDALVRSFHRLRGVIRARVPLVKSVASIITIGSGGSAGREGPIAQIGAGVGSILADRLKMSDTERRYLLLAGAAGGIGAIFRAPLGGALFTVEVLYATAAVEYAALVPCVISSVTAYAVFTAFFSQGHTFTVANDLTFHGLHELPIYLVFAVLCAVVGFLYVNVFYGMRERIFKRLPIPNMFKPAIGGFLLGAIALVLPHVMAGGYGWVQQAIDGTLKVEVHDTVLIGGWAMIVLALAKIVATSFTISSGGSGGVFAPSLFIGAMLGGAYGQFCHEFLPPGYVDKPGVFVLVGMGGFFAGVAKVPLTALIMVSEMSGSYELLVPMMLVTMVTVAMLSSKWTLYEEQVPSLIDSPAHLGDFMIDVLARIHVREVYQPREHVELVPQEMPLLRVMRLVSTSPGNYFPVVDDDEKLVGIFSLSDVRAVADAAAAGGLIVAADIATFPVLTVTPDDDLHTALRRFTRKNIDELPVVSPDDPQQVLGMLRRKEVILAYDQHFDALRHEEKG